MKKNIIIICLLLLVCFLPINTFGECIKGDCVNGQGVYTFSDRSKYVGEWKDNKLHGKGVYTYPVGIRLICEWKDGKFLY